MLHITMDWSDFSSASTSVSMFSHSNHHQLYWRPEAAREETFAILVHRRDMCFYFFL